MPIGPKRGAVQWRQVRVGAFLIVALLLLGYGVFRVADIFDAFSSRYTLYTLTPSANGLTEGSPVHLAGQRVGQIDDISFIPVRSTHSGMNLIIRMSLAEDVKPQIRRNSIAYIRSIGLLGDKIIDIQPGTAVSPMLGDRDTIPSSSAGDLEYVISTGAEALDSLLVLSSDLRSLTLSITRGEGTIGKLFQDDRLYGEMVSATSDLRSMLASINRSDGTLNRLIHDPKLYEQFTAAATRVDALTADILAGRGTLGRFLRSDTLYTSAAAIVASADSAMRNLNTLSRTLVDGKGSFQKMFTDPQLYDQLLKSIVDMQTLIAAIRANPKLVAPTINVDVF